MKYQKWLSLLAIITLIVVASTFALTACSKTSTQTTTQTPVTQTLKIGGTVPLSGPPSVAGISWKQGWDLALEKINSSGGVKIGNTTYQINLMIEDDKGTAEGCATAATKLVLQQGCKVIMGALADFEIASLYDVTSKNGALLCENMLATGKSMPGSFADVGPDKPLLLRMSPATSELDIIPIQYLVKTYPQAKNVGLISLAFPDYDNMNTVYAAAWAPLGITVSKDYERVTPDTIDFVPSVTRLLATKPDVIYILRTTPSQFPLIVKAARDAGFNGPIMFPLPMDPIDAASSGVNLSDVITAGFAKDDPNLPDAVKQVVAAGRAKFGKDFVEDAIFSYDELMLLTQIMQKASSTDPATMLKTFEGLTKKGDLQSIISPAYAGGLKTTGVNRVIVKDSPLSQLVKGKGVYIGLLPVDIP